MATKNNRPVPARAVHPGEILREELLERGIKQKDFAQQIGVQATHLNEFIKGKRDLNEDLAMKLEKSLGIPFKTWMSLHSGYVYDCKAIEERETKEEQTLAYEAECDKIFNIKLLYKILNIVVSNCVERVEKLKSLFSFDLLSAPELKMQVAGLYKLSDKVQIDDRNLQTWLLLNWIKTSQIHIQNEYVKGNALIAAQSIAKMANNRTLSIDRIKECLLNNGIAYVELGKLDKVPVDAYSTFTNGHPVITVTYRYNDMDKLAFDILHELCHIDKHLTEGNQSFISIEGTIYSNDPREKEANEFAKEHLIPNTIWNKILKRGCKSLSPNKIVKAIAIEAEANGISPSIAISRFKHDTNWYYTSEFKSPKIK